MQGNFTILIADKNRNVRDYLRRELSPEGYQVLTARDGEEVMRAIEGEDALHLLILDLDIPGVTGLAILEKIQGRKPPLPVIIHTFLTEDADHAIENAAGLFVEKSGNIEHLKSAIADMLKRFYPAGLPERSELPARPAGKEGS